MGLSRFHLAPRKLPQTAVTLVRRPLADEVIAIALDHGCEDASERHSRRWSMTGVLATHGLPHRGEATDTEWALRGMCADSTAPFRQCKPRIRNRVRAAAFYVLLLCRVPVREDRERQQQREVEEPA